MPPMTRAAFLLERDMMRVALEDPEHLYHAQAHTFTIGYRRALPHKQALMKKERPYMFEDDGRLLGTEAR